MDGWERAVGTLRGCVIHGDLEPTSIKARYVLVVPAYRESIEGIDRLLRSVQDDGVLVIVSINEHTLAPREAHEENAELLGQLAQHDRVKEGMLGALHITVPKDEGVGGARAVGCSLARNLQVAGKIESHWLHNTDADSLLCPNYFSATDAVIRRDSVMALHGFRHHSADSDEEMQAASLLRSCLHLGELGLSSIQSPWAFLPSGVGVSVTDWAYDAVGGWPKYSLAEDIHMVCRLSKLGRVHRLPHLPVSTSCRSSSKCIARPGEDEETCGHGSMIASIAKVTREGYNALATSPQTWKTARVLYGVIRGYLSGLFFGGDVRSAAAVIADQYELEVDPCLVEDCLADALGPIYLMCGAPGPGRTKAFWSITDQWKQVQILDMISSKVPREPAASCVNGSPWGIRYDGDWMETAQKLALLVSTVCNTDVGLHSEV